MTQPDERASVKVRPLEWRPISEASKADTYGCRFIAHVSFGEYFINSGAYGKTGWSYSRLGYAEIEAASADEAKAAAQADYEQRILSAIDVTALKQEIESLRGVLAEWATARAAFVGLEPKGGKEALNRLSEAESKLADLDRAIHSPETVEP